MVFESSSNKRWKAIITISVLGVSTAVLCFFLYLYSLTINPDIQDLSELNTKNITQIKLDFLQAYEKGMLNSYSSITKTEALTQIKSADSSYKSNSFAKSISDPFVHSAFVLQRDAESVNSMKKNIGKLDLVFLDAFTFSADKNGLNENIDNSVLSFLKENHTEAFASIASSTGSGNLAGTSLGDYIRNAQNRTQLCSLILKALQKYNFQGVNLDIDDFKPDSKADYLDFLSELKKLLYKDNKYLSVNVQVNDVAFDYKTIGSIADMVIIKAYNEDDPIGNSGPVASGSWFIDSVKKILKDVPEKKIIVSMGQYSYDWNVTKKTSANTLSYGQAIALAKKTGANIQTEIKSVNSTFSYKDSNGDYHEVWMLDAISLWNEIQSLKNYNFYGIAIYRTGLEEPTIWNFFSEENIDNASISTLEHPETSEEPSYVGSGVLLKVTSMPYKGTRILTIKNNIVYYASYSSLPSSFQLERFGQTNSEDVVLTFDDGPDPLYTNPILDVLKKYNVKATFFVVGSQAQRYPEIIKRIIKEGHIVGNHTFSHPNLLDISEQKLTSELNSTLRLIEGLTGKQMLLFRSPYSIKLNPSTSSEITPLYNAGKLGYIVTNANVDSNDYENLDVDKTVASIINQFTKSESNVILMHDGGGNREKTIAELNKLIPLLKEKGYNFANINDLLKVSEESLMPEISGTKEKIIAFDYRIATFINLWWLKGTVGLFLVCNILVFLRLLILGILFGKYNKKHKAEEKDTGDFEPFITVLIPAYNEEKVIGKTLEGVLKSNYDNFEIIVINDGSKDNTEEVVQRYSEINPKIKVVSKPNGGKYSALNLGFNESKAKYIVTIDADTVIFPDTIKKLVAPFRDSKIDAVCGNIRVGNVINILTNFQSVEYITGQNFDRRAFDMINSIFVVPGATGAWKREKVLSVGGYSDMTLTEDTDLTLAMLKSGARIVFSPDAVSVTEAPENIRSLFKQRFRWCYGTFQCLWKYKKFLFKGKYGWFVLAYALVFQLILPLILPIGDLVFLFMLLSGNITAILGAYLITITQDVIAPLIAFKADKAPFKQIWIVFIQRFFYRQFMYIVTFRSIIACFKGKRHSWNKLARTSSVNVDKFIVNKPIL